jgi:rubrerythrin
MGIFKELLRDFADRNLTDSEMYIKRAQEAEAKQDWSNANFWYEQAEEWEKAGDVYVTQSRSMKGSSDFAEYILTLAAKHYFKARRPQKMRKTYEEYFERAYYGLKEDHVQMLKEAGELDAFMQDVFRSNPGSELSEARWRAFAGLFDSLFKGEEYSNAAQIFLHYRKTLHAYGKEAIQGLLRKGDAKKAVEITSLLAKDKLLKSYEYSAFAKMFLEVKAYNEAEEVFRILFSIEPSEAVRGGAEILAGTQAWQSFLSFALKEDPLNLGKRLRNLPAISWPESHGGGEIEADFLLKCYEAVGPQSQEDDKEGTTRWLYALTEFWKARGDRAKEGELRYRLAEDKQRLGIVHFFSGFEYASAAWAFADKQDFGRAAETMEKAALTDHSIPRQDPNFGFWYPAAKLYEKVGNCEKAAELYDQCGQSAKASRLRGTICFDAKEAGTVVEALKVPGDSKDWISKKAEELATGRPAEDAAGSLLQELEKEKGGMWEDWLVVPVLYKRSKDKGAYTETLRKIELKFRNRGRWVFAAKVYLFEELYDEFEKVCIEENELEVAALWYDKANMPERAAKIYDLMGQGGKSGKAQSEGAKQKPHDAARPKSESAEDTKGDDLDQLVCPQCGAEVKPHWTVCPKCNADLQQRKCRNCGEPLEPAWKRCPACMTPVTGSG